MILNQFREWARTAGPAARADGASALARAYLYSKLPSDQRTAAVDVLTGLLDDPSPLVRLALAEAFASAIDAPHHIVLALADDQPAIAAIVLSRSPVLCDAELIDCAAVADAAAQSAIAGRASLSAPVGAALAEIAAPEALAVLAANRAAPLPDFSIRRMVERHGDHAGLREALLARSDLPPCVRLDLVAATTRALAVFVTGCNWLSDDRMKRVAREEKDKAAMVIAETSGPIALIAHLRQAGQLSVGFTFRTILSGKLELFRATLSELSGMPMPRVDGLIVHCESTGFAALYRKAGLPLDLLPAFRIAIRAARDEDWTQARGGRLSRRVIERVLTGCDAINSGELDKLLVLLRRFETEAARADARRSNAVPLTLKTSVAPTAAPLLLTDLDASDYSPPATHGRARVPPRREPVLFTIDMAAIEAELCAA
jgi:uncharacterized protein (DUF2336 family)